ncbi:LCP family protein [Georgenia sp. M64]|uniref:LCP family protein n=1 Tax=Georgenia sp. M64 TaxID=3120520 RepID=UPI0030DF44B3
MSENSGDPRPPSFRPAAPGRRPDPSGARPVGVGAQPAGAVGGEAQRPAHPRRTARPDVPVRRTSVRGAAPDSPPAYAPSRAAAPSYAPAPGAASPPGPAPAPGPDAPRRPAGARRGRRRRSPLVVLLLLLLVVLVAWPVGLAVWADSRIQHVEALSSAADTPGTTYLLAGSDSRADGAVADATEGQRSDTIMIMHVPESGPTALVSLPRDTLVTIPGVGENKLNAAFSLGGPPLLVETVEGLTGLGVDHYVEIGMGGVSSVVDAVGGVELCLDYDVADELSGLTWTAGCAQADGVTALAFARMRYADPNGDIGRTERQRQVVSAVVKEVAEPTTALNPAAQVRLVEEGTGALLTDPGTGIVDLGRMALAFRAATGPDGLVGTPPIADLDHRAGSLGSTVLLADGAPDFFARLRDGELTAEDLQAG